MDAATEALVHEYLGLAQSLAQQVWRQAPHALELDEMKAIAYLGLVGAAHRWWSYCAEREFDPGRLEYFRPFVVRRVKGALIDEIRRSDFASRSLRTRAKALADAGQGQTRLTDFDLAARTGMTVAEVRNTVRGMAARPVSLEAEELDLDGRTDVESSAVTRQILGQVTAVVIALPRDQQAVLALHYHRGMQLQQVAETMAVTETNVSQLHAEAVLAVHDAMLFAAETAIRGDL